MACFNYQGVQRTFLQLQKSSSEFFLLIGWTKVWNARLSLRYAINLGQVSWKNDQMHFLLEFDFLQLLHLSHRSYRMTFKNIKTKYAIKFCWHLRRPFYLKIVFIIMFNSAIIYKMHISIMKFSIYISPFICLINLS